MRARACRQKPATVNQKQQNRKMSKIFSLRAKGKAKINQPSLHLINSNYQYVRAHRAIYNST